MNVAKLAVVLVQVGSQMWINPGLVVGIRAGIAFNNSSCKTYIFLTDSSYCSDWPVEKVKGALENK